MIKVNKYAVLCNLLLLSSVSYAADIEKNTAQMQALDKITGRISEIEVPVGGAVNFGSFSVLVHSCKTRPVEEAPDNFAFVDVVDKTLQGDEINIFKGWMISSSPATHAVEHPIFDVWLLKCIDTKVDKKLLLSAEELAARDNIPMAHKLQTSDISDNDSPAIEEDTMEEIEAEQLPPEYENEQLLNTEFSYDEEDTDSLSEEVLEDNEDNNENSAEELNIPQADITEEKEP